MTPRYERLIPLLTLILVGLGIVFLLDAGPVGAVFNLGGDLPTIPVAWPLVLLLCVLAGLGAEWVLRGYIRFQPRMLTPVHIGPVRSEAVPPAWILPGLTPAATFAFFRLFRGAWGTTAYLAVLIGTGAILLTVYLLQPRLWLGMPGQQESARTGTAIITYLLAFGIFAAVAFNRYRTLYAALLIIPGVILLSYDLLRTYRRRPLLLGITTSLVLLESYWVLNFWPAGFLLNAAALLLIFYAIVGIFQHSPEDSIPRRVLLEYGSLTIIGLLLLGAAAFILSHRLAVAPGGGSG